MKIRVNTKRVGLLTKIAETFGKIVSKRRAVTAVYLTPQDYYGRLSLTPEFYTQFDREPQTRLRNTGIVGYFWGAVVRFDYNLKPGEVRFATQSNKRVPA